MKTVRTLSLANGITWIALPRTDRKAIKSTDILRPKEKTFG